MSVEFTDEQFAAVFRVLPVMAHSIDREGRLVHVSDAWLERLKYERDDVIGRPLTDFLTEEGRNRATGEVIPRFFREGRVDDIPYAFVASDGEIVDILLSARAVSLPDQRVGALGVLIDVTRQRESEREAFRDRHLLERFFAALPDAAVLTDTERRLVRVSAATKTIFGYEPEELLGKTTEVFYPSSDAYSAQGQRRYNAHADPTLTTYRSRYKRADGSLFEAETVGGPLYDDKGRHVGNLGIMRNIEPQLAAERARDALEAEVAQRQKLESLGMLASGIAHDFNNLLVPILGNASVMRLQLDKDGMQDELLDDIVQSATQAGALCRQLLAYAGKDQMVTEVVSLPELVSSLAPLFRSTLPVTCELVREGDDVDTPVRADPSQLQQVAMNLILNAADALGGAPGTVVVRTGVTSFDPDAVTTPVLGSDLAAGRYASLEVEDTGCGMSPEAIATSSIPSSPPSRPGAASVWRRSSASCARTTAPSPCSRRPARGAAFACCCRSPSSHSPSRPPRRSRQRRPAQGSRSSPTTSLPSDGWSAACSRPLATRCSSLRTGCRLRPSPASRARPRRSRCSTSPCPTGGASRPARRCAACGPSCPSCS
jgi:two-component system cell cycle sensor histidine kinase/response regulator CckA